MEIGISRVGTDRYLMVIEQPPQPQNPNKPRYYFTLDGLTTLRAALLESHAIQLADAPGLHWVVELDDFAMESHALSASITLPEDIRDVLIQTIARIQLEPPDISEDPFI